jgi:hypothetical protein
MKKTSALALSALLLTSACAAATAPRPAQIDFADRLVRRAEATHRRAESPDETTQSQEATLPLALSEPTDADRLRGLLDLSADSLDTLRGAAATEARLAARLAESVDRDELAVLAWLLSPTVRAAEARYRAARTAYAQSKDLGDLVALYRSFARDSMIGVGPEASRRGAGMIAPSPNVDAISGEITQRRIAIAWEELRSVIRDTVADAWRAHADAAHLQRTRAIVREELALDESLLDVLRARLESGRGNQAGYLAFEARLERLRTELAILGDREAVVRARWNQLLGRPDDAPTGLVVRHADTDDAVASPPADAVATALVERQELRIARLRNERAELAVRLAETMTLPRMDVGSARFERERAGEAGAQRGPVFPEPGRGIMPRADFGVREAQVAEMRARSESTGEGLAAMRDAVRTEVRRALFARESARRRVAVHETSVVPLAERAQQAARGAYEGNRAGYIEILDAVRRALDARIALADARRDAVHADAGVLRAIGGRSRTTDTRRPR